MIPIEQMEEQTAIRAVESKLIHRPYGYQIPN